MESPPLEMSAPCPPLQAPPQTLPRPKGATTWSQAPGYPLSQSQAPALAPMQFQPPLPVPPQALSQASSAPTRLMENLMHKNHLQRYCQKLFIPLPEYQTVNEGHPHAPRFRSTVWVDGRSYTSPNTFTHRKAAEQDVAKLALEQLPKRIEDTVASKDLRELICQDIAFCKMIVNEFAIKMNMEKGTYQTVQTEGLLPVFVSSLVLNGIRYDGEAGKNKKEAEQLAARAAILSLLGDPTYVTSMCEVIKSKIKLYAAFNKVKDLDYAHNGSVKNKEVEITTADNNILAPVNKQVVTREQSPTGLLFSDNMPATVNSQVKTIEQRGSGVLADNNETVTAVASSSVPVAVTPQPSSGAQPSLHEFKLPNSVSSTSQQISLPIVFVPSAPEQDLDHGSNSSKKRRKNKKKANKRSRIENSIVESGSSDIPPVPLNQPPPCSVAR